MKRWQHVLLGRPESTYQLILNVLAPLLQIAVLLWLAFSYRSIPDTIPTHYNFAGDIDGYGGKGMLWLMPIIGIVTDLTLWAVEQVPQSWNLGTAPATPYVMHCARDLLAETRLAISALFASISAVTILHPSHYPGWLLGVMTALAILPLIRFALRAIRKR